jgi:tripartite-type tricarboxylate transporter receptor subunit TctC
MKMISRLLAISAAALTVAGSAYADNWPTRPVKIVVPYAAGGSYDAVARQLAQHLGGALNQSFVVENKPGAGGTVGADLVAKSPADGYTLVFTGNASLANNQLLYKRMPYDGVKDFSPIAMVAHAPMIVAAHPSVQGKNLAEALRQSGSTVLNYGSPGNGTIGHLTGQLVNDVAKSNLSHIPYRGDSAVLTDLMGGSIQLGIGPAVSYLGPTQAGKIRILAVASPKRLASLPDVPTAQEQGIAVDSSAWMALAGPAGLPAAIVNQLNTETNRWLESADGRKRLADLVLEPAPGKPADMAAAIVKERAKWSPIVERLGIKLD